MTVDHMRTAIQAVLNTVPFSGLSVDYCAAVRDALRPQLPGAELDVCYRGRELAVEARDGGAVANVTLRLPG